MSSLQHDNNGNTNNNATQINTTNGGMIDFGQALTKPKFKNNNNSNQTVTKGGDTAAPLIYQDPAILGGQINNNINNHHNNTNHQMNNETNHQVPDSSTTDAPLTVSEVEADAVSSSNNPTPNTTLNLTAMASMSASHLLKSSKPSHTNNPLMTAATNVPPENGPNSSSLDLLHALKTTARTAQNSINQNISESEVNTNTDAQFRVNKSTLNAKIIDVYQENLQEEFKRIRRTVKKYRYVAMDTEFPGVVAIPEKKTKYQQIRVNVDLLNIIQLGLCFMNEKGEMDPEACCWQFNFRFSTEVDMYAEDSINLLKEAGIPFKKLEEKGIDRQNFAELFITSGICLNNKVNWITFHAGYDFAYMLKLMRNDAQLPESEEKFFELLNLYFPNLYDIKYMVKSCKVQEGGLEAIANELDVDRIGDAHTAGSDAVLTGQTFFKVLKKYFCEKNDEEDDDENEEKQDNSDLSDGRKTPENTKTKKSGASKRKGRKNSKIENNTENDKTVPEDPLEARKQYLQNQNKNTEKYRGIIYGIGSGVVNYHNHSSHNSRYGIGGANFSSFNEKPNFRGSTIFSSPGRNNTNTPPGIAIVKPNKESQALVFTKPPADHDEKSSNNGSIREKDSREVKEVSKSATPTESNQIVPEKVNNEVENENNGFNEGQVPVSAV